MLQDDLLEELASEPVELVDHVGPSRILEPSLTKHQESEQGLVSLLNNLFL